MWKHPVNRPYFQRLASIKGPGSEDKLRGFAIPDEPGEKVGAAKFWGDAYPDKGTAKIRPFRGKTNITSEGDSKTKTISWPIDGCDDRFGVLYKGPWQIKRPKSCFLSYDPYPFLETLQIC